MGIKQQQIKFEEMHKQKNEVLKNESAQNNTNELEKEYEAKMNILQSEYAQIANSCKSYEESMKFELIRKKKEMDAMYMKKESVLKKKLYKQIRDEMQKEMDAECMKMFKMQELAQSDLNELNVLKESNKKQMNEINALKMKSIENNQKIEKAKKESIKIHFDAKEEKIKKHKREQ